MKNTSKVEYAWVHLLGTGGCNIKTVVWRKGKSVFLNEPQSSKTCRIKASVFDEGKAQFRGSWVIEKWGEKAERVTESERDWQT